MSIAGGLRYFQTISRMGFCGSIPGKHALGSQCLRSQATSLCSSSRSYVKVSHSTGSVVPAPPTSSLLSINKRQADFSGLVAFSSITGPSQSSPSSTQLPETVATGYSGPGPGPIPANLKRMKVNFCRCVIRSSRADRHGNKSYGSCGWVTCRAEVLIYLLR